MLLRYFSRMASSSAKTRTNRLINEKSAYLLQHAHNPVDWYPWGHEAFEKAKYENKPIFLSVGYSTCHWCHVMEHESFNSVDIASYLNENFVPVKMDREERPDIDKQYMMFVQAMSGAGGWPMSVWLTPDLRAIMAGTYYPPEDNLYGRPGFKTVLKRFADMWKTNRSKLVGQAAMLTEHLGSSSLEVLQGSDLPSDESAKRLADSFRRRFDSEFGGFSKAPKFPQPGIMLFLLRYHLASKIKGEVDNDSIESVFHTLKMMARGGIYDHIAKGFHRYSTDPFWHVPHFEKMLYDQAQLAVCYSEAAMITKSDVFARVLEGIISYMVRDLRHPSGGFFSAEDADSYPPNEPNAEKKIEGAFYVWTHDEITSVLKDETIEDSVIPLSDIFCAVFDVRPHGNVNPMQDPHNELRLKNVLICRKPLEEHSKHFGLTEEALAVALNRAIDLLNIVRNSRPRPHRDEKFVASWNGMAISGLAKAGMALNRPDFLEKAIDVAKFIRENMFDETTHKLFRTSYAETTADGNLEINQLSRPIPAVCNDYCCVIAGLLDLYEATLDSCWVAWADELQNIQNKLFWDPTPGRPSFLISNNPDMLFQMKDEQDGAEPGNNSVACMNLLRLADYMGNPDLREMAERIFKTYSELIFQMPIAVPHMLAAYLRYESNVRRVVVGSSTNSVLWSSIAPRFDPYRSVFLLNDQFFSKRLTWLDELRAKYTNFDGVIVVDSKGEKVLETKEDVEQFFE